ncbi:hypothetical protein KC19_1G254500 [Ceratodon purpureus]|uniref:MPV17 n=1 Tax=Ceratodon purpureus TaxID=3225 RepID=A0A8T0J990_CERPU|nr:hypothetical protein KC19_1G254500 [Ceratodon purpureus]
MEAMLLGGGVGQVHWALAGHAGRSFGYERACVVLGSNPGLSVRCRGSRREHRVLKVRAVSADGGGGEGNGERFGRGGGGGDNGGDGGDGGRDGSDGGDDGGRGPEASSGIMAWYMDQTNRHPISTKAITAAILNLLGDIFCQLVIDKSDKIDIKRTAVITFLGFILVGPTLHTWYLALSKVVTATGFTGAAIRLVLDQFLFSPAFVALFFASLLTLEGRPKDVVPKLKQDWKPAVIANWKLWIPFQFVNFLFVPQQLQVAFANVVALAWNVYLSFASHKEVAVAIPSATVDIEMSPFDDEK